jgi:hypothetical protein
VVGEGGLLGGDVICTNSKSEGRESLLRDTSNPSLKAMTGHVSVSDGEEFFCSQD